jgi:molybdopterin-guanine dinucleotide biosynthesis protein A
VDAQDSLGGRRVIAAIITGGQGRRLGGLDKSSLVIAGRSIAERQLQVLRPRFSRVLAVAARPEPWASLGVTVIGDRRAPGAGPLAGIDAALAELGDDEEAAVCVAGDMPFLSGPALELLRDGRPEAAALVATSGGHAEPLFARYGRACAPIIAEALATGRYKAHALLERLSVSWLSETDLRALDPELLTLANVNTPEDLAAAERRALSS